ncbi:hypothetical protein [Pediococcus claussenii]|uniref:Uncharacterized protein n=1 Tax=Pediococcus claussenii (strain ATCC BAA-344 / DSM 14800 / JCM 18046 / KCTC 3811 / LMG 21948 / P06) TaxID=701521 RepID=G8PEV0_PEDCP|nr:hypothetical protein [Pediococcus claussenii]AEV94480.1 hypothetical protein PECL_156 [Pediococcus claussenii ATCC BAA-344]
MYLQIHKSSVLGGVGALSIGWYGLYHFLQITTLSFAFLAFCTIVRCFYIKNHKNKHWS